MSCGTCHGGDGQLVPLLDFLLLLIFLLHFWVLLDETVGAHGDGLHAGLLGHLLLEASFSLLEVVEPLLYLFFLGQVSLFNAMWRFLGHWMLLVGGSLG